MAELIFVTGTDTGIGKTLCSAAIASYLKKQGYKVAYIKPVETGFANNDAEFVSRFIKDTFCFYKLATPISPHLAAKKEGIEISINEIKERINSLSLKYDYLVIEGAGGLLVPITASYDFSDLVKELEAHIVLVVGSRLGVLNQAKLNFEYIRTNHLNFWGYVFNQPFDNEEQKEALRTNRLALIDIAVEYEISELFSLPLLAQIPDEKTIIDIVDKTPFSAKIRATL